MQLLLESVLLDQRQGKVGLHFCPYFPTMCSFFNFLKLVYIWITYFVFSGCESPLELGNCGDG